MRHLMIAAVFLMASANAVFANSDKVEVNRGRTAGDGYAHLAFTGEPDEQGLIWQLQEPLRDGDLWAISVYNGSKETRDHLCKRIEYLIDGTWYLSGMGNAAVWLMPFKVGPGEFAIGVGDRFTSSTGGNWDEARLVPCDQPDAPTGISVDLRIRDLIVDSDGLAGEVLNGNSRTVTNLLVYYRCVDRDGIIYGSDFFDVPIRKLDPKATEPFEKKRIDCDTADDTIINAVAKVTD